MPPPWVAKSASWYMNDPLIKCKIWYMNRLIFQNFPKIGSNLRKFWKNQVICSKFGPIGIWMGHFFLKNWYLYGSTTKFGGGTSLPKPNLSTPGSGSWARSCGTKSVLCHLCGMGCGNKGSLIFLPFLTLENCSMCSPWRANWWDFYGDKNS